MPEAHTAKDTLFVTIVHSEVQRACARMLIDSLHRFGGEMAEAPVWVFEANPYKVPCRELVKPGVELQTLVVPQTIRGYLFAEKVSACALAEGRAPEEVRTLIWLDPAMLMVAPPVEYLCEPPTLAAVRPVHIQNVGSLRNALPSAYWQGIFHSLGVQDVELSVESFVDDKPLRAYFNTHAFAIDPRQAVLRHWLFEFEKLVLNRRFQAEACSSEDRQVFLHQAVLSTLLASRFDAEQIHILPPSYNYPYHLQQQIPEVRRVRRLNDLVTVVLHEDRFVDPRTITDIEIEEPLHSWLLSKYKKI
jgi:hypothetical protein